MIIPVNQNGLIPDPTIMATLADALACCPDSVTFYSHGWQTNATSAMTDYARFGAGLARVMAGRKPTLGIGIHWPSTVSEDDDVLSTLLNPFSFYTCEHRADAVGQHALSSLTKMVLSGSAVKKIRFIGHSFGCKLVCAALQSLVGTVPSDVAFEAALIQPAFENDALDIGGQYSAIHDMNVRLALWRSGGDYSLGNLFPAAQSVNLFRAGPDRVAMGFAGPNNNTLRRWEAKFIPVGPGYYTGGPLGDRMVVVDTTELNRCSGTWPPPVGSHGDIFHVENYKLIDGFFS
jgi:hypothetical protein